MELKDWIEMGLAIGTPTVGFIITYTRMQSKFESHELEDAKSFTTLMNYSKEFFTRITDLEKVGSAQVEKNRNHEENLKDIKDELSEIKALLLGMMKH